MTKKTRGRPLLDPNARQRLHVHVRLTPRDYDDVQRKAAEERISLAEYFRRRGIDGSQKIQTG